MATNYQDPVNPLWLPEIVQFKAAQKAAGLRYTKQQLDAFDDLVKTVKAAVSGISTQILTITLDEDTSVIDDTSLINATILICLIGGTEVDYDFTNTAVFNPVTGQHNLGQTFYAGTKLKYLYNAGS